LSNSLSDILHLLGVRIIPAALNRCSTSALLGNIKSAFTAPALCQCLNKYSSTQMIPEVERLQGSPKQADT